MTPQLPLHIRQYAIPIAQHEVGHFIAGRVLGFRTGGISLKIEVSGRGHRGGAAVFLSERLASVDATKEYLRRRVQTLYAGVIAQTLPQNGLERKVDCQRAIELLKAEAGSEQDYAKAREAIYTLRNLQHCDTDPANDEASEAQLKAIDVELWGKTVSLVEVHAEPITRLATFIVSKMIFTGQQIEISPAEIESHPAVRALIHC